MSVIATLLPHALHVQRLRAAIRDRHELRECADWAALARVCDREPVRVAVVDLFAHGSPNFEGIRALKQRLPRLTLVAYVTMAVERGHDLFDAGRAGIDGLVLAGEDDAPRPLLAIVEQAEARGLVGLIRESLKGFDPLVVDAMLLAVTRAHERLGPAALAKLLAMSRRSATERLVAQGFPPPQRLLTWGRLVVAAHMLEDRHRSADRVANMLEFPSGSAFRNTCQRYLGATPGEIRAHGGAAHVMRALLAEVHSATGGKSGASTDASAVTPDELPALAF
ncbi:MAG TPA: helix-turn-helix domain-containing protein [Gemmatimonadaceae bacterium]|jgi:AraC-like DNA-binding protein|nr:helix-turn-helix domain-containing protein [Gemmatimonadaceae bacterium]